MHPDLIQALAHERRAELHRAQQFRDNPADAYPSPHPRGRGPLERARRSVASALVHAGIRLMPPNHVGDLAVYVWRESTHR